MERRCRPSWYPIIIILLCYRHAESSTTTTTVVYGIGGSSGHTVTGGRGVYRFTKRFYNTTIPENSIGRAYVKTEEKMGIYCSDPDVKIRYKITNGNRDDFFRANERSVGDFWFLIIRTRTGNANVLNREQRSHYQLTIKATITYSRNINNNSNKLVTEKTSEAIVYVTILDTNDINPLFLSSEYEVNNLSEDTPLHTSIVTAVAEDADLGINGEVYYYFQRLQNQRRSDDDIINVSSEEQFAIHPTTGVITLTRPLSYTDRSFHQLTVLAKDRGWFITGGGGRPSSAKVKIRVQPANLYSPVIYVRNIPRIAEEQSNTGVYAIVRVTDKDRGIHGEIDRLEIVDGDPDGLFKIKRINNNNNKNNNNDDDDNNHKKDEYSVEVTGLLDRETSPRGYNLTLRAVDKGTPPKQTYTSLTVTLTDVNDNAPVFDRELYDVNVPETTPINTPIVRVKVTDADEGKNGRVSLQIVGGNEGREFRIAPDTGTLYTAVLLDAESKQFYTLTVSALDQGNVGSRKQSSAKIKVNVIDANDNDPLFERTEMSVTINENEPAGSSVITVVARDKDSGENAYISYAIANLNPVPFEIDHFSGLVKTAQILDYESTRREYTLRIRASDWGLPYRRQTEMQLKITVRDVNDNRPQFERVDCVGHVLRTVPIGREIITLSAVDFDAGNIIAYRIVSGNEDGCFALDAGTGILSVTCDLTDVAANVRELNVTATDGVHFSDTARIRINLIQRKTNNNGAVLNDYSGGFECRDTGVTRRYTEVLAMAERNNNNNNNNKNNEEFAMMPSRYGENVHTPEFVDFPKDDIIRVNESLPLGATVIRIKGRDRDLGYNGKLIYGISSGDPDSVFRIDLESGHLKLIGYLDRERTGRYDLNVTVYDLGKPQKSVWRLLRVLVLDVNDNPPKFRKNVIGLRLSEDVANGTIVYRFNATDDDSDLENRSVFYTLITEETGDFTIDKLTGALFVSGTLDRERRDYYELTVRATDNADELIALHADVVVRIRIDDVNDNAPTFVSSSYALRAREDLPIGTVISVVTAKDPDLDANGDVRYSLKSDDVNDDVVFAIDRLTGTVRLKKSLDFERRQVHTVVVIATDRGSPALSSETVLTVEVVDVNENLHAPTFDDFVVSFTVEENQPAGTTVGRVRAVDNDPPGDDSKIAYTVREGNGLGYFTVDSEGTIRTLSVLDAETKSSYWLMVYAQDYGVVPLHSILHVYIVVLNVNDNVPLTVNPVYNPHVTELNSGRTSVVQLNADDKDVDANGTITYRITSGNEDNLFSIDSDTGLIETTGPPLDRESQSEYILEVTVYDNGSPQLSSTTRVIVTVDDVNDNAPKFENKFYKIRIPESKSQDPSLLQNISTENELVMEGALENSIFWENFNISALTGQPLFRVIAIDSDDGNNGTVRYSINSGKFKGAFTVHPITGVVYSDKVFVASEEYTIKIRASDGGNPCKSSVATVTLFVNAIPKQSEHAPVIKQPDQAIDITESDSIGFLVHLIQAVDEDGDDLWYKIENGDPNSEFTIGENGNVLLAKQLDWESEQKYNLTISVSDGVNVVYTELYVNVVNINEYRPEFTKELFAVNVSENLPIGSKILKLNATDLDRNHTLFYSIHNARNPASLHVFKLDFETGVLSLAEPLDRESISQHLLTVMVKDEFTPAKRNYARVVVDVYDANDHAPEFSSSIVQGRVFETSSVGTTVVQVFAVDKDHGDNAAISYHITSGNIGNVFSIDETLGTIQLVKELDINSVYHEYLLNVKAFDKGIPQQSSSITVHIVVVMADNAPPKFSKSEVSAELFENEPMGTVVKCLEARSTSSLIFDIVAGNEEDMFEINPSSGAVITKRPLDYETTKLYNITVMATNMAAVKTSCSLIIHVLDRNDNVPTFLETEYQGFLSESSLVSSLVLNANSLPLVIKAQDDDSEMNALLQYEIIEPAPRRMFHIVSNTGAIRTVGTLDYESTKMVDFHVRVNDLGKPRLFSDVLAHVRVNITDINDCPPVFSQQEYNAVVIVPTYKDIAVVRLNATDRDSANLTKLSYSITDGNSDNIYAISPETGLITVNDVTAGMHRNPHRLKVEVTDGYFIAFSYVNVKWEKSEDSGLIFQRSVYYGVVQENKTKINTVVVVNVIGSTLNENLLFDILNPTAYFEIGRTSGAIRTTGLPFDRETQEFHLLIVQARSDEEGRERSRIAHVPVNVTVLDENDNCPMFVNLPYYAVASVDAAKGDIITKVHAIDLDKGENGDVRYELSKGHGELFKVDRKTGEISLKQILEGHNKEYQLIITAYDGGLTPCVSQATVTLKVMDRSMPVFNKQFYAVSVSEDVELPSPLSVSIKAESPLSRKLIYSISNGNALEQFSVDFNTAYDVTDEPCVLYVVDHLDYEQTKEHALTVRATDSISGIYAEVLVNVLVLDANDCPPEFEQDSYNVTVSEAAPFGSLIAKVVAKDNDTDKNNVISYSIQKDIYNSSDFFHIDSDDGSIYLKRSLDRETRPYHHFVVVATDNGFPVLSSSAHIWLTVLDVNDNAPKFEQSSYICTLSEDAVRGQFITNIAASDPDTLDYEHLTYSIVGGNQHQTFALDSNTGIITLINLQKLTNSAFHMLNVSVSDGVYTSFARVRIEILISNRHTPVFEKFQHDAYISENQAPGSKVVQVHAVDRDHGLYGQISYSILSQHILDVFHINNVTGEIITKRMLDREENRFYEMTVLGTDGGGRCGSTLVRVTVTDQNDNKPEFLLPEYKACIYSNLGTNSFFMKVKAFDKDDGLAGQVEYTIFENEPKGVTELFGINKNTGGVVLLKPAKSYENQIFQFFIRSSDRGTPPLHSDVPIDVYIMSTRDTPPVFERNDDKIFISENASAGNLITKMKLVNDVAVKYKLISSSNLFSADEQGQIILNGKLDREEISNHAFGLLAYTDSSPPLTALAEIQLQIIDVNDHPPEFDNDIYSVSIPENIPEGTAIVKVHATDKDEGKNAEIRYSLDGNSLDDTFTVDTYSGSIVTVALLDRETKPFYTVDVIATDNGTPSLSARTQVRISLIDCNDNPSTFTRENYHGSVKEDALAGTVVIKLTLNDADTEIPSNIAFYITSGNPRAQFSVRSTGEVYVCQPLDRESIDRYEMNVLATDGKFVTTTKVIVTILDVNDERPYCLKYRYRKSISEATAPGIFVLSILASDADQDPKLRFYLNGPGATLFDLDKNTGELKVARHLDREQQSKFELIAHVQDKEQPDWECLSHVEITLTDVNDNAPLFNSQNNTATIPENADIGTLVTKMHATDADIGLNRKIRYYLINSSNGHFAITSDTGIVTLAKPLDRETQDTYNITVKAVDQGAPQLSSIASLLIIILDVNDNPPEFVSRSYYASIPEISAIGTEVLRVSATSLDTGINAEVVYSVVGGNEHGKFAIVPETGIITVAQQLDYERVREYLLTVQATDLGTPPLSNQAVVNISITDVNDNSPVFNQLTYSARVREDISLGDIVLKVTATDLDSGVNGKISYYIERGDKHQQFTIDKNTGHITVTRPLDRELVSSYRFQIRASDNGYPELLTYTLVIIEVDDVNDNPPYFSQNNYTCIVQEDRKPGWSVCQLNVTDADVSPNGPPFVFDTLSGNGQGSFRIESNGTIRTTSRLKYKVQEVHSLHIRVFDNGTPPLYSDAWVTIKVIEESQFPPSVIPLDIWVGSYQDRWPGGQLGRIHATDQDPYDTLFYNVLFPHNGLFNVNERTGVLSSVSGLDTGKYILNVSVTDGKFTSYAPVQVTVDPLYEDMLNDGVSVRLTGITPHQFILTKGRNLVQSLKSVLLRDVQLISVQESPEGHLDILLLIKGGAELGHVHDALHSAGLSTILLPCHCIPSQGTCKQRIIFHPDQIQLIATDVISFVAPTHSPQLYCSCVMGFAGTRCENKIPTDCSCPDDHQCLQERNETSGYKCVVPPVVATSCDKNATCPPFSSSNYFYTVTVEQMIAGASILLFIVLVVCLILVCRRCRHSHTPIPGEDKNLAVLNSEFKRNSKINNLEVTQQHSIRPTSYSAMIGNNNNDLYVAATQLNNLDTLRSYGSAGDELENIPADYVKNLNRHNNVTNKITNDLKLVSDIVKPNRNPRRTLSCVEEARLLGGYHWDCSDWVRHSQNPLPNITEVPGSEIPDSSSFHSNESNESRLNIPLNSSQDRDMDTYEEDNYISYKSEDDDVIPYGFPHSMGYPSQSDLSTNVCDIEDSDVPQS